MLVNPKTGNEHFARVKVPPSLPRLLQVGRPGGQGESYAARFVPLEDVIAAHLDQLFPGMEVLEHTPSGSPATRTSRSRRTTPRTS